MALTVRSQESSTAGPSVIRSALHRLERHLQVARLEALRMQDDLLAGLLELLDVVAGDALVLDEQDARLCPLAAVAELDVADDGLERVALQVVGELGVVERADRLHGRFQDLHLRVGEGWNVEA